MLASSGNDFGSQSEASSEQNVIKNTQVDEQIDANKLPTEVRSSWQASWMLFERQNETAGEANQTSKCTQNHFLKLPAENGRASRRKII